MKWKDIIYKLRLQYGIVVYFDYNTYVHFMINVIGNAKYQEFVAKYARK